MSVSIHVRTLSVDQYCKAPGSPLSRSLVAQTFVFHGAQINLKGRVVPNLVRVTDPTELPLCTSWYKLQSNIKKFTDLLKPIYKLKWNTTPPPPASLSY